MLQKDYQISISDVDNTDNIDSEYARSIRVANDVFKLVEAHTTPPVPQTYDLWYQYVQGNDKALNQQIDAIIDRGKYLNQQDIELIHQSFADNNHQQINEIGEDLEEACLQLMSMLTSHINLNDGYENSLIEANAELNANPTPENLKLVVKALISENEKVTKNSSKLKQELSTAVSSLEELNEDLRKSRKNELTDPLTLIGNRKKFNISLAQNLQFAQEKYIHFSVVIADLDYFKIVNDNFGHLVGDAILKLFAKIMIKNVKGRDVVTRYGGEEFALILPNTDLNGAFLVAEQIRLDLSSQNLQVTENKNPVGVVTASFGISQYRKGDTSQSIVARADKRLYEAKRGGRNQVKK